MSLSFQENGNLQPGVYEMSWEDFTKAFGTNKHRQNLISGLRLAISHFKAVGCKTIYIGGSFVTKKQYPNDYDSCWEPAGVDFKKLFFEFPVLVETYPNTKRQKDLYGGEFYPAKQFLPFFQKDRDNLPKGIVKLQI